MAVIKSIRSERDYRMALSRLWELFHSEPGTPEGEEFQALADLLEAYDDEHYPIPAPPPHSMIEFWLDQRNLTVDDLVPAIGSPEEVTKVLSGEREVTPEMAQALYDRLDIDVRHLLGQPTTPVTGD